MDAFEALVVLQEHIETMPKGLEREELQTAFDVLQEQLDEV